MLHRSDVERQSRRRKIVYQGELMHDGISQSQPQAVFYLHWIVLARPAFLALMAAAGIAVAWILGAVALGPQASRDILYPAALSSLGLFILALGPLMQGMVRRETTAVEVYGDRIVYRTGLFQTLERTLRASEIVGVDLAQDVSQRLLGCGNLRIDTRGVDSVVILDLENAATVRSICQQAVGEARGARRPEVA